MVLFSSEAHYAAVRADLDSDAQDLEAESWSLAVDPQFVKNHTKEIVKRQDVIYGKCDFIVCVQNCRSAPLAQRKAQNGPSLHTGSSLFYE